MHKVIQQSEEALNANLDEIILENFEEEYVLFSDKNTSESDTSIEEEYLVKNTWGIHGDVSIVLLFLL